MTPEEQQQVAQLTSLSFSIAPVQVGQEIRVLLQVATAVGVMNQYSLSLEAARLLVRSLKQGVEKAEVTLVKPPSALASA